MIRIFNVTTGEVVAEINEEQFDFLMGQLEEESVNDTFYITHATIDYLEERGADEEFIELLHKGVGDEEGIEIIIDEEDESSIPPIKQ